MITTELKTRTAGPLVFSYEAQSFAEENLDSIVASYEGALAEVCQFLGVSEESLPRINVCLCSFLPGSAGQDVADRICDLEAPEIWSVVNSESAGAIPAIELTRLLLTRLYGPASQESRFWYDGLAGHLAASGGASYEAEAPERVRKLFETGQLPPLIDLLEVYGIRQSATGTSAATAFVGYLIERYGPDRYKRLLGALRDEDAQRACSRIYGVPVQSLEQGWYLQMETSGTAGSASMVETLKQLLPYMNTYKLRLLAILVFILFTISFAVFMPNAIRFLGNNILGVRELPFTLPGVAQAGERLTTTQERTEALFMLLGAMIFMFVLSAIANTRRAYLVTSMGEGINFDLRMQLFNYLQRLPAAFHRRTPNQDITARFWTDVSIVASALTLGVIPMTQSILAMTIFGLVLISLNWKLSLIALAGLPIFAIAFQRSRAKTRDAARERTRRQNDVGQSLTETLNAQEKIKLYGLREYLTQRFVDRLELLRDLVIRITLLASASASTSALITNGAQVAVLVLGGLIVIDSQGRELAYGDLMAFYVLLLQLYAPAGILTNSMQFVNQATTSVGRVNGLLQQPVDEDPPDAVEIEPLRQALRLTSVSYSRTKGKDLIKDLTLEITAGQKVAFVGPPGSGKADLLELLPRLSEVDSGSITWDGIDFKSIKRESLRRQLAVVSQDTYLFNTTVYNNICYGRIEATDQEAIEASKQAGLHDFITGLAGGYDTQVNDRDPSFGLAQRQRMAVARALLQNGSVILMDDALSALDTPAQRELETALCGGPDGSRTLIRVAQRIGSVKDADMIYVMDGGKIVEQGTDDELSDAGGVYTQLVTDELGKGAVSGAFQAARRLARQEPFNRLPPDAVDDMARKMLYTERTAGETVCRQGGIGDEWFFLGRGEVEIVVEDDEGDERIVNTLHEGDYFGEISFLLQVPRTATVRARTPVELHMLRRQDFDALLQERGLDEITQHLRRTAEERMAATRAFMASTRQ